MRLTEEQEMAYRKEYDIDKLGEYELVLGLGIDLFEKWSPEELVSSGALDAVKPVQINPQIREKLRNDLYEGTKNKTKILYLSLPYTAARASSLWESYFCHGPTNRAVGIGWCGELEGQIDIGSFIIPDQAVSGEGITPYYFPEDDRLPPRLKDGYTAKPAEYMMKSFVSRFQQNGLKPLVGKVYSIEAMKCETKEIVEKLHQNNFIGIDLESSAFLASAEFHGKNAVVVFAVSDKPYARFHNFIFPRNEIPDYFFDRVKDAVKISTTFLTSS
jgi:purine-nucleoside phosphorylase